MRKAFFIVLMGFLQIGATVTDAAPGSRLADSETTYALPYEVTDLLTLLSRRWFIEADEFKKNLGDDPDFIKEFVPLFYQKTVSFEDGKSPAWLIGYRIATYGRTDICRFSLLSKSGTELLSTNDLTRIGLERESSYSDGIITHITTNRLILLLSVDHDRWDQEIYVILLQKKPQLLLKYNPGKSGDIASQSELYLTDLDGDGCNELVITAHGINERSGKVLKKKEKLLVYKLDKGFTKYVIYHSPNTNKVASFLAAKPSPTIMQYSRPVADPH